MKLLDIGGGHFVNLDLVAGIEVDSNTILFKTATGQLLAQTAPSERDRLLNIVQKLADRIHKDDQTAPPDAAAP